MTASVGCFIELMIINSNDEIMNESSAGESSSLSCDREFSDCRQQTCFVQSPNYPGVYPRNRRCLYHISTRQPFIKVTFDLILCVLCMCVGVGV